jgi:glucose/arabinose dehydrogenase
MRNDGRQLDWRPGRRLRLEQLESRRLLAAFDVLVFSKTAQFRHGSIGAGVAAIQSLGATHDFSVTPTEDAGQFTLANLTNYEAVVFLNTTGDVLNETQQSAFEQYIQGGGGWVGVHSAADTEYSWNWYGELLGAYFQSHPAIQSATIVVADQVHPSTAHLPQQWNRTDEWYNYRVNPRGKVHVLATLDESSYSGGADGFDHPIAWYHDFDGGRAWYTGLGHTNGTYAEPAFRQHLLGGILYAAGQVPADGGATIDANFQTVELYGDSLSPMSLEVARDGRVFFVEKGGAVKMFDPAANATLTLAQLNVYTGQEDGLLGIALDPQFESNQWIYLFYSPRGPIAKQHLSRFTLTGNQLDPGSERIVLEVPTQRDQCCHSAGSLAFDHVGNLYLSTGDDTNPFESDGYAPIDERPGRSAWDAQKSSSNTEDLRGKILRIRPQPDGSYTIPDGNLFPVDGSAGRPEIYIMGNRNPFRISLDAQTGALYWGDVGPDANSDAFRRGPRGHDEINRATTAGNYGWPYFVADNRAYVDYDFATGLSGASFDPLSPVNDSPNNTGLSNLPAAQSALIWYHYGTTDEFPELGSGGRTAMAGPMYHFDPTLDSPTKLPSYFDDTLFIYDWSRRSFHEVKFDANGEILKINPFLPQTLGGVRAIDMELGPDGSLYLLEWNGGFGSAPESRLLRVEFLGNSQIISADFDLDGDADGQDFLAWQRGVGLTGGANRGDGDADGNGAVNAADLNVWETGFGAGLSPAAPPAASDWAVDAVLAEDDAVFHRPDQSLGLDMFTPSTDSRWRPLERGHFAGDDSPNAVPGGAGQTRPPVADTMQADDGWSAQLARLHRTDEASLDHAFDGLASAWGHLPLSPLRSISSAEGTVR